MARTYTLAEIRTRCKERSDLENSNFISDTEWNSYIDGSYTELYDLMLKVQPEFYQREQTITGDGSTNTFTLPADYYGTIGVDFQLNGSTGVYSALSRIQSKERNKYSYTDSGTPGGYRFVHDSALSRSPKIQLLPPPQSGDVCRHVYVVAPKKLTNDNDIIDGVSGWEEYIIVDVSIKAREKEETSTTGLERQKEALMKRIEEAIENRSIDSAGCVSVDRSGILRDPADYFDMRPW